MSANAHIPAAIPAPAARAWWRSEAAVVLLFTAYAAAMHVATWGDTNYFVDDTFYALVGQRMHDGLLPYVDVWDRKPFGLFAIYWLIAGVSRSIVAYQIAGLAFSVAAAVAVCRIAALFTNRQGGVLAGIAYLCLMCTFDGVNGQSPVFYNALIAWAVWCVASELDQLARGQAGPRIMAAMALCGLAITIKQTTLFEGAFLGLYVLHALRRAGVAPARIARQAALMALLGAAPTLAIAAAYAAGGHWHEYWNAMVTANLHKRSEGWALTLGWIRAMAVRIVLIAGIAAWALRRGITKGQTRGFLAGWTAAALVGFLSVPNFFIHYALPLMVPFSVLAAFLFALPGKGRIWFAATLCFYWLWYNPLDFGWTRQSRAAMAELAELVERHDGGGGLFVYDGPPYLYALTGKPFLSPLVFPHHFNHLIEKDTSHLATAAELDRILARHPGVVVLSLYPRNAPVNEQSYAAVRRYIHGNCRLVGQVTVLEMQTRSPIVVYGDCAPARR